jgi:hypothetical protein
MEMNKIKREICKEKERKKSRKHGRGNLRRAGGRKLEKRGE